MGLAHWQTMNITAPDGRICKITATPARHGPADGDRGPVIGFVLNFTDAPDDCLYISGDTVWYEGVEEVARRFHVRTAVLFMGAAVVPQVGSAHLTMTAQEGVLAAMVFKHAFIVPLHHAGWEHFTESRDNIEQAFDAADLQARLFWPEPGIPKRIQANFK
jgi:hypothetical protein